jgi:hypothetical protein
MLKFSWSVWPCHFSISRVASTNARVVMCTLFAGSEGERFTRRFPVVNVHHGLGQLPHIHTS